MYKRVFLLVLDSLGVGAMPDADKFGDTGANTLGHIAEKAPRFQIPFLQSFGLANIIPLKGITPANKTLASYGKLAELSNGKDTTTGHWEMAGLKVERPFPTYYDGFPQHFMDQFLERTGLKGFLGNIPASGTEIIQQMGDEHIRTGFPIVYTSADSVFQIACHEEHFGLERLYEICEIARTLCDELGVARVIARPFIGSSGAYKRTGNRKDYSIELPGPTIMHHLQKHGLETISIGKVASIYSEQGFSRKVKATNNQAIFDACVAEAKKDFHGLLFANLVDFDMLYGHRRDVAGYAKEIEWFDRELPKLLQELKEGDLLLLSADHGNDPTAKGSDHTREYVPILAYSPQTAREGGKNLGTRKSFADIGQSILSAFELPERMNIGESFLD